MKKKDILHSASMFKYINKDDNDDEENNYKIIFNDENIFDSEKKIKKKKIESVIIKNNNDIFKELIKKQLPDAPIFWKLTINDIKRLSRYINTSIFDKSKCCIWNGYITNVNNSSKGTYVNFYFKNKKVALHRLLYSNFVEPLNTCEYIKFSCKNRGICCNVNHYEKYKYSKISKKKNIEIVKNNLIIEDNKDKKIIIDFD